MRERQNSDGLQGRFETDDELVSLASTMSGFVCPPVTGVAVARAVRRLGRRIGRSLQLARLERDFARPSASPLAGNPNLKGTM